MTFLEDKKKAFGLSEREALFDRVTHKRLIELVKDDKVEVVDWKRDSNSYGDFRFITLRKGDEFLTFYGHGYHDYREGYLVKEWHFYFSGSRLNAWAHGKNGLLNELKREHQEYLARDKKAPAPSERGELFSILADLGDEDGAIADLEDAGYL